MSIIDSDLQAVLSEQVSDSNPAANGGRPGNTLLALSAKNNVFTDLDLTTAPPGPRWRKVFLWNLNSDNLAGLAPHILLDSPSPGPDWAVFSPGGFDEVQSDVLDNAPIYGSALLSSDANAGDDTISITLADASLAAMLQSGQQGGRQILISSRPLYQNTATSVGFEETATIASVMVTDRSATLGLAAPLRYSYSVEQRARASVLYQPSGPLGPTLDNWAETGSGHYDKDSHPVILNNLGTIRQDWTINYTSASGYTLAGDTLGLVGTYSTGTDAAPVNPAGFAAAEPYLIIPADGHGTAHAAGDKITFSTYPAAIPIWVRQHFPASMDGYNITKIPLAWSIGSPS